MDIESLENVIWLIENDGEISIGNMETHQCAAAVACDEHGQLAALVKKPQESVSDLLIRLDQAIENAWEKEEYIDEINE